MKNLESISSAEVDQKEKYNFPEIESFREGLFEICEKMKAGIESNKWTKLLSDETGGRIPTLVIWNLIKHFHPDNTPQPFFLSSGLTYKPKTVGEVHEMLDFMAKIVDSEDTCLLVTQFIRTGKTIKSMISDLEMVGVKEENIDVASVVSDYDEETLDNRIGVPKDQLYVGTGKGAFDADVEAFYPRFTGVIQDGVDYDPVPVRLTDNVKQTGKRGKLISHEEWKNIFDIADESFYEMKDKVSEKERITEYNKRNDKPLSAEEIRELQDNVNKAREDVSILVKEIIQKVWGEV
ncbi:MAG: hypothetical protein V4524_00555 [Patescibacteria group bacterium]